LLREWCSRNQAISMVAGSPVIPFKGGSAPGLVTSQCRPLTVTAWASFPRGSSFLLHNRLGLLTLLSRLLTVCPGCNLSKLIEAISIGSFFPDITRTPYAFQNCWQCHPQVDVVNLDLECLQSKDMLKLYESNHSSSHQWCC